MCLTCFPSRKRPLPQSPPPQWNKATARLNYIGETHPYHLPTTWTISIRKGTPCLKLRFFSHPPPQPKKNKWEVETRQIQILHRYFSIFLHLFTFPKGIQWECISFTFLHRVFNFNVHYVFPLPLPLPPKSPPRIFGAQVTPNPGDLVLSFGCAYPAQHLPTTNTGETGSSGGAWAWTPWKKRPNVKNLWEFS